MAAQARFHGLCMACITIQLTAEIIDRSPNGENVLLVKLNSGVLLWTKVNSLIRYECADNKWKHRPTASERISLAVGELFAPLDGCQVENVGQI